MLLWTLLPTALALAPVVDFRVPGMDKVLSLTGRHVQPLVEIHKVLEVQQSLEVQLSLKASIQFSETVLPLMTDKARSIYYLNLQIGDKSSKKEFPLLLDTGSGISWIMNESCTSSACSNGAKYSSSVKTSKSFSLSYSGSHVNGEMVNAAENNLEFVLGDLLKLTNYSFGLALTAPDFFENFNLSGILGVQARYDDREKSNMLHQLYYSGDIDAMQFAIVLDGAATNGTLGGLFIAGKDATKYSKELASSDIQYCDVLTNDQLFWMLNITEVHSNKNTVINGCRSAIIDTGTTGMALPMKDATAFHEAIFGSDYIGDSEGNFAFRCNATGNVSFVIDNHTFNLPVGNIKALAYELTVLQGYCASKVQGMDLDNWILGASFLSEFYTIFDLEHSRVGFAPRSESESESESDQKPESD
ncbi:hypothetical protein C7M61_000035 [Candidozyma pseudohaemuli]|uniref:Peptidase A1 domain-containing protein n=1 Tax=Candidozyma pseudohaemuli TaxID=418784 RepID=A0A2P7YWP7_9ASCO|nr:hypothetical protein C7M61_000035 [[Candida] pseudohaemulonii]PSK40400.1 hypothetical protein C7M61_000035 [[Candida] pseudohaemulonii]